ncbi:MAG: alpha/beta hydrolase [Anaerolineaceae bacterium]|nr:alpha/beta hydrolase [Anaerolineaceae bacterium]
MQSTLTFQNDQRLAYAQYGDPQGFPILIQHGLIASIEDSSLFDRLLQAGARLICIARPGYGASSPYRLNSFAHWADLVGLLIQELQLSQFDVLGMSSGAPYGYAIGCQFPHQTRHIYVFSGIPALYDEQVLSDWPFEPLRNQIMAELEDLAGRLFFSDLTAADLQRNDIRDSSMHHGFGVAQDLGLRFGEWGFRLSAVSSRVFMRHSRGDEAVPYRTAVRTAQLLPHCQLELLESGPHFSASALDDFIQETVVDKIKPL